VAKVSQQDEDQQGGPNLELHRVGVVPEEVPQLQRLFELLEKHLDAPTAAIEFGDAERAPEQVVGQEHHLLKTPINLHQRGHPTHQFGVGLAGFLVLKPDQIIAQDRAIGPVLDLPFDAILHVVLGPRDPEDAPRREVGQMGKVHVGLVKHDDFALLNVRADLAGALAVAFLGGVDDGELRQETLQVQPQMTFGGGFAAPVPRPVHAVGHQLDRGGIDDVDGAPEATGKPGVAS